MFVELTSEQRDLLLQLVDAAVRELGPEIRHTDNAAYRDDLREQRRALREPCAGGRMRAGLGLRRRLK